MWGEAAETRLLLLHQPRPPGGGGGTNAPGRQHVSGVPVSRPLTAGPLPRRLRSTRRGLPAQGRAAANRPTLALPARPREAAVAPGGRERQRGRGGGRRRGGKRAAPPAHALPELLRKLAGASGHRRHPPAPGPPPPPQPLRAPTLPPATPRVSHRRGGAGTARLRVLRAAGLEPAARRGSLPAGKARSLPVRPSAGLGAPCGGRHSPGGGGGYLSERLPAGRSPLPGAEEEERAKAGGGEGRGRRARIEPSRLPSPRSLPSRPAQRRGPAGCERRGAARCGAAARPGKRRCECWGPGGSGQRRPSSVRSDPPPCGPGPCSGSAGNVRGRRRWAGPGPAGRAEALGRRAAAVPPGLPATPASLTELFPSRSGLCSLSPYPRSCLFVSAALSAPYLSQTRRPAAPPASGDRAACNAGRGALGCRSPEPLRPRPLGACG